MSKIILNKQNKPFKDEETAQKYIDEMCGGKGDLVEIGDGWGILSTPQPKPEDVKYWLCRIAPRQSDNEDEIVDLNNNGQQLQVRRGTDVILPEPFVLLCEDAVRTDYELRGSVLVRVGETSVCPIVRIKEVTYKEYREALDEGTKTRDREIREQNRLARS